MFKESFKYYKSKWPVPDFTEVVDFDQPRCNTNQVHEIDLTKSHNDLDVPSLPLGMHPIHKWRCYSLTQHPGLLVIRNPFTNNGARYWIARCLRDYPRAPNVVNLNERLFSTSVLKDWWHELQECSDKNEERRMKISMRWATLGYHHNWDTKVYSEEMRNEFPADLSQLCSVLGKVLGFQQFNSQAAIVNYYPIGTTLAGHTDHSEVNLTAPLFSISFGQTAIFLIGGQTKEEKPTAMFLKNGDILIMSRESRLCYHAVPRVMKASIEDWNEIVTMRHESSIDVPSHKKLKTEYESKPSEWHIDTLLYQQVADEVYWLPYKSYLNDSRINVNVRQVLNGSETQL